MEASLAIPQSSDAPAEASHIESELVALNGLDLGGLRLCWRNRFGRSAPPTLPRHLLLRLLAYRIQVEAFGGLSCASERHLGRLGRGLYRETDVGCELKPGTILTREWHGRLEQVMATREGFAWRDSTFPSLSAVATTITGTRWNGRRFFGLGCYSQKGSSAAKLPSYQRVEKGNESSLTKPRLQRRHVGAVRSELTALARSVAP